MLQQFRWFIIIGLAAITFILGYIGFDKSYRAIGEPKTVFDLAYLSAQLFVLESGSYIPPVGWELEVARFLALVLTISTLIIFLLILFYDRFKLFCLRFFKDHVVICGLGILGQILSRQFTELGYPVVVIEKEGDMEEAEQCRDHGAFVLTGDATHPDILKKAQVHKAKYLILVLGNDGQNAEVAGDAAEVVKNSKRLLSCFVHIVNPEICTFLKAKEIGPFISDIFRLEFINIYQSAGRSILKNYPPFSENELQAPYVHILVVGAGRMGVSFIVNAIKKWREIYGSTGKRLKISIIDRDADNKKEILILRYPSLERYCELTALKMEIHSPEFVRGEYLFKDQDHDAITYICICLGDETLALSTALVLNQHLRTSTIPIVMRTNTDRGIATLFRETGEKEYRDKFINIHVFPIVSQTSSMDFILNSTHELIAQAIHEEYVQNQKKIGKTAVTNPSMVDWDELQEHLKESNRKQADNIIEKLDAIHCNIELLTDWDEKLFEFTPEEVENLAIMEHERWMKERIEQGWRYGPVKDIKKKVSPSLISWENLSEDVKEIDRNAVRSIPSLLYRVDLKIIRL
ncbi:NAD-binding protein [Candidatus Babeliales bacterium]|nr:NAD-binding protein [Candidatus Babeliales bacterium]